MEKPPLALDDNVDDVEGLLSPPVDPPAPPPCPADERPVWGSKLQYILAQVGFSVGLGNVWRFPYLCHQNGGGAFLLLYFLLLVIIGIPLFFLELAAGQSIRQGSIGVWKHIHPRLTGIGYASCVVCFFVALYYNVIIAWSLFYLGNSFQYPLPWESCPTVANQSTAVLECSLSSPTTYFWYRKALDITDSIEDPVTFNPVMTGCLLAAWTIVCLAMIKGIQSSGKVMYFSSLFPYLVLLCFLIRGLMLEGAADGIKYMFYPRLQIWLDMQVWRQALTQVFFALGLGFGSVIAYSSYNPRGNNCHRDAVLVSSVNFLTSLLASLVVFAVLGFRAHALSQRCVQQNMLQLSQLLLNGSVPLELAPQFNVTGGEVSVTQYRHWFEQQGALLQAGSLEPCDLQEEMSKGVEGTGLAFITFTEAIALFPASPLWSFLFFLMLLNLGLSTMFGTMQGILTPLMDSFSVLRRRRSFFTVGSCVLGFLFGMVFVLRSGSYFVSMFDDYSATLPLVIVVLFETVGVCWVYGTERFMNDIEDMLGWRPPVLYKFLWQFVCVASLVVLLLASLIQMCVHPPTYRAWEQEQAVEVSRDYPGWGLGILAGLILLASLPIPVLFLRELLRERGDPEQPASLRTPPPEPHRKSVPEPHAALPLEQSRPGGGARHNSFLSLEEEEEEEECRLLPQEEEGLEEYRLLPQEEEGLEEYRLLPREEEGLEEYRLLPQEEEGLEEEGSFQRTATTGL